MESDARTLLSRRHPRLLPGLGHDFVDGGACVWTLLLRIRKVQEGFAVVHGSEPIIHPVITECYMRRTGELRALGAYRRDKGENAGHERHAGLPLQKFSRRREADI